MAAIEIGDGVGGFRSRRRREFVRDRANLALVDALATTTAAATTASTPAWPALAILTVIALAVAGKARLFLGFVLVGFAFLTGRIERRARLAKRGFAFLARSAGGFARLGTTAA